MRPASLVTATAVITTILFPVLGTAQQLEEITVTARKTSENLQEVPIAVTAISAGDIERLGIKNLNQVTQQDTSVQFDQGFTPSDTRVTIRGLSPTRGRPNNATLVDGIDVGSEAVSNPGGSTLVNPRLMDVERIEIVKGPQSALYGRSAFAGAIQYVTKDPDDVLSGSISGDFNNEEDKEIRGSFSVPLTETLGMRVNGYAWDDRGYHKNEVTDDWLGGGKGWGTSVTFKWEPSDTVDFKWRTEYTDDETAPIAQMGLNSFNTWWDMGTTGNLQNFADSANIGGSNLAPGSTNCGDPATRGPLANYDCLAGQQLNDYFLSNEEPPYTDTLTVPDLGLYDSENVVYFTQYNRQVFNGFVGDIPSGKDLRAIVNPNYQWGPGATDPANAIDYKGTDKEVFRTSLVANWAASENIEVSSYTAWTNADVKIQQDIGRFYVDECSPNLQALIDQDSPLGGGGSYYDDLDAEGFNDTQKLAFAPCDAALGPDGINDASGAFTQDDLTETTQFSQEVRMAWQLTDSLNFTTGLLYWYENLLLTDRNNTLVVGGPECNIFQNDFITGPDYADMIGSPVGQQLAQVDPIQNQCGNTALVAALWQPQAYQARLLNPSYQRRKTHHYSWYGSLDFDLTERFTARLEARYSREDNDVVAPVMTPCLNGAPANDPNDPDSCSTGGQPNKLVVGAGGQPTGPSTVVLCGQVGRCDRMGIAPISGSPYYAGGANASGDEYSWWPYGYLPMLSNQVNPGTRTDRYWTPKLTLEYLFTDDIMAYTSWSRGIKPGGYSLLTIGAFGLDPNLDGDFEEAEFEPERLDVWELGAKTTLWDGRIRFNSAVFYQDFKDKQISVQKFIGGTTGVVTENIDGSEIWGFELDATMQVTDNLTVQAGYTRLNSEYTDYTIVTNSVTTIGKAAIGNPANDCSQIAPLPGSDPSDQRNGCVVSFNGNQLERSPENAWLLNLSYNDALYDTGLDWYAEGNYRYQDSRYLEQFNIARLESYSQTDVRFGIQNDWIDVQLYVNNVFDDDTARSAGSTVGIPNAQFVFGLAPPPLTADGIIAGPVLPQDVFANLAPPRTIGLRATMNFGD